MANGERNHRNAAQRNRRMRERLDDVTDTLEKTVEVVEQHERDLRMTKARVTELEGIVARQQV